MTNRFAACILSIEKTESRCILCRKILYPYRRFPTIQAEPTSRAVRGTDAVKNKLHDLCLERDKSIITIECYPGVNDAEILSLFPKAALIIHADELAIAPAELDAKIEHELTDDNVFGIMTTWRLLDFYPSEALCAAQKKTKRCRKRTCYCIWCWCITCNSW